MNQLSAQDLLNSWDKSQLIQYVNEEVTSEEVEEDKLTIPVDFANSLIDDSLRARYEIPLSVFFISLKEIGIALANYKIYERRNRSKIPEQIQTYYDNAILLLNKYMKGQLILPIQSDNLNDRPPSIIVHSRRQKYNHKFWDKYF